MLTYKQSYIRLQLFQEPAVYCHILIEQNIGLVVLNLRFQDIVD